MQRAEDPGGRARPYPGAMGERSPGPGARRRLVEELAEAGLILDGRADWHAAAIEEVAAARWPVVHERRVPSYGAIVAPTTDPLTWDAGTDLHISLRPVGATPLAAARRFADGLASWVLRHPGGGDAWAVFDRPAGSERDLVVLAEALGAVLVQRHPSGTVRVVGGLGVFRWDGLWWRHEPPLATWIDVVAGQGPDRKVLARLLEFAVHDLGAHGTGALLVHRPEGDRPMGFEERLPTPPPLDVRRPADLAPLRHALAQVDGAAVFDADGILRQLGVRLIPTPEAESGVAGFRGMRHTSGRRYSFDDPEATVIVVSEDGPVSVLRAGRILGASPRDEAG